MICIKFKKSISVYDVDVNKYKRITRSSFHAQLNKVAGQVLEEFNTQYLSVSVSRPLSFKRRAKTSRDVVHGSLTAVFDDIRNKSLQMMWRYWNKIMKRHVGAYYRIQQFKACSCNPSHSAPSCGNFTWYLFPDYSKHSESAAELMPATAHC